MIDGHPDRICQQDFDGITADELGVSPWAALYQSLQSGDGRAEAAEVFRTLSTNIAELVPGIRD